MKIIKLIKQNGHYSAMFDVIPEITYEKVGSDYIGSSVDLNGSIIASSYLGYESWGKAFGGRELNLTMKDGTIQSVKDYWYDCGSYKKHGEFIGIGAGTLEGLQDCFVYFGFNINKDKFNDMIEDYLSRDRIYTHDEVKEWCNLQHSWYNVIVHGEEIPFMMNKFGNMVERETKKGVYSRENICRKVKEKYKTYVYFKFKYKGNDGRLLRLEANYLEVLRATLPFPEDEIKVNCKLK